MRFGKATILAFGIGFLPAASAHAWKPITHAYLAQQVVDELIANNGSLNIEEVDFKTGKVVKVRTLKAVPELYEAVKAHPAMFYNGVVGPDAYPDFVTGQVIVHPPKPEGTGTDHWWKALWTKTHEGPHAKPQNLAFMMGMFAHSAGDMFAHSFVNAYAGGPFSFDKGPPGKFVLDWNAVQHNVLEGYIFERTPTLAPHQGKNIYSLVANEGMNHDLAKFLRDVLDPYAGLSHHAGTGHTKSIPWQFGKLRKGLVDTRVYFQAKEQAWRTEYQRIKGVWANTPKYRVDLKISRGAELAVAKFNDAVLGAVVRHGIIPYINAWVADIEEGLIAWPKTSHAVAMALMFQDPAKKAAAKQAKAEGKQVDGTMDTIGDALYDYWFNHGMKMVGVPDKIVKVAQAVAEFSAKVGQITGEALKPIQEVMGGFAADTKAFLAYLIKQATGFDIVEWKKYQFNPASHLDTLFKEKKSPNALPENGSLTVAGVNKIMGLADVDHVGDERFEYRKFAPAFNTVNMIKLSFLSVADNNALIASLGSAQKLVPEDKNVMLGSWLGSMDAGNQWMLGDKLVYARDCSLFRKVFLGHTTPKGGKHEPKDPCMEGQAVASPPGVPFSSPFSLGGAAEIEIEAGQSRPFSVYGAGTNTYSVSLDADGQPAGSITNKERRDFMYVAPSKVDKQVDVNLVAVHDNKLFDATVKVHVVPALAIAPAVEAVEGGDNVTFNVQTKRQLAYRVAKGRGRFANDATLATLKQNVSTASQKFGTLQQNVWALQAGRAVQAAFAKLPFGKKQKTVTGPTAAQLAELALLREAIRKDSEAIRKEEATYYAPADAKEGEQVTVEVAVGRGNKEGDRKLSLSFALAPKNAEDDAALAKQLASNETLQTGLKEAAALEAESRKGLVLLTSFKSFSIGLPITNIAAMKYIGAINVAPGLGGAMVGPGSQVPTVPATPGCGTAESSAPLKLFWSGRRQDNFVTATPTGASDAVAAGYDLVRTEGRLLTTPCPGTIPLKTYWGQRRGDNMATSTAAGEGAAKSAGYSFVRIEGYVYEKQEPNTIPLKLYWNAERGDNMTLASPEAEADAKAAGYTLVRIEGYILAPSTPGGR